jgi:hypothetical protein
LNSRKFDIDFFDHFKGIQLFQLFAINSKEIISVQSLKSHHYSIKFLMLINFHAILFQFPSSKNSSNSLFQNSAICIKFSFFSLWQQTSFAQHYIAKFTNVSFYKKRNIVCILLLSRCETRQRHIFNCLDIFTYIRNAFPFIHATVKNLCTIVVVVNEINYCQNGFIVVDDLGRRGIWLNYF